MSCAVCVIKSDLAIRRMHFEGNLMMRLRARLKQNNKGVVGLSKHPNKQEQLENNV